MIEIAKILEHFLAARKATTERVGEEWNSPTVTVVTYLSYDTTSQVLVEDVVVGARG